MFQKDYIVLGSATAAGGIPEDLSRAAIQVAVGLFSWFLTKFLERRKNGKKEKD